MPCGLPAAFMKHGCRECGRGGGSGTGLGALQQGQPLPGLVCLVQVPAGGLSGTQQPCWSDPTRGARQEGDFMESVRWNRLQQTAQEERPWDETIHSSSAPVGARQSRASREAALAASDPCRAL